MKPRVFLVAVAIALSTTTGATLPPSQETLQPSTTIATDASDVQALQQNGVQTLLVLIVVFGLATLLLWMLFPFRLGRARVRRG